MSNSHKYKRKYRRSDLSSEDELRLSMGGGLVVLEKQDNDKIATPVEVKSSGRFALVAILHKFQT